MKNADRVTKGLLILLILGVFSLIALQVFHIQPAQAAEQPKRYAVGATGDGRMYIIELIYDIPSPEANIVLSATDLLAAIRLATKNGWKLHTVISNSYGGGYNVILEK